MDEVELLNTHVDRLFENLKQDMNSSFESFDKKFKELQDQVDHLKEAISNVRFLVKITMGFVVVVASLSHIIEFLITHFH